jgi:DNA polymerase III delta prime subunit
MIATRNYTLYFESEGVYNKHEFMTSYIVVSNDKKKRLEYIEKFRQELNIDKHDLTVIDKESSVNQQSIGIEDVKNLQAKIFLKPLKSETKVVVLNDAQLLTVAAQNALLKMLEEPPGHTNIVLSTDSIDALLPTIISRCQIVNLQPRGLVSFEPKEKEEFEKFIKLLPKMKIGEKLKKAEELSKDKDAAIDWIERFVIVLREKLLDEARGTRDTRGTCDTLNAMQSLHTTLKTSNVNPRFAIENTLLSL